MSYFLKPFYVFLKKKNFIALSRNYDWNFFKSETSDVPDTYTRHSHYGECANRGMDLQGEAKWLFDFASTTAFILFWMDSGFMLCNACFSIFVCTMLSILQLFGLSDPNFWRDLKLNTFRFKIFHNYLLERPVGINIGLYGFPCTRVNLFFF